MVIQRVTRSHPLNSIGASLSGGFRSMALDMKYNKGYAGEGRWYPEKHDLSYAYGFTFKNGFTSEALDQENLSWTNGKRVMNGTLNILLLPIEIGVTGIRGLDFIID